MTFKTKSRYGKQELYEVTADVQAIVLDLLGELKYEQFETPDDEHTQIAVSHDNWSITVRVSGLVSLDDLSGIASNQFDQAVPSRYMRDVPDDQLVPLLEALARGDFDAVFQEAWLPFDQLPPYTRDFYRM